MTSFINMSIQSVPVVGATGNLIYERRHREERLDKGKLLGLLV